MQIVPTLSRAALLSLLALVATGADSCDQSLDGSAGGSLTGDPADGDGDGASDDFFGDTPLGPGDGDGDDTHGNQPPLEGLAGECAPVQWLTCGDVVSADTSDPNSGTTNDIDFWPVSIGNYEGPEIAYAFRPDSSGEASVRFIDPTPNEMNQDIFVGRGTDRCVGEAAFGRGFNGLDFEAEGGVVHYIVVDGYHGDAGAFELELECDLGGSTNGDLPAGGDGDEAATCDTELDVPGTVEQVMQAHDVADMDRTFMPGQIAMQQGYDETELCFDEALSLAVESFLRDGDDIESPLSIVSDIDGGPCLQDDLTERVRCFMNRPGSRMDIIVPGGPHQAEHGEGTNEAWVFFLDLPELSDHLYWAVVPRDGERGAYNYGFN